jgi:hypothetical protein
VYLSDLVAFATCCMALRAGASRWPALFGLFVSGLLGAALFIDPPCWSPFSR